MTNAGLTLYDLLKSTHVRSTLRFLDGSQHWSLERLEELQQEKLVGLLDRVSNEVPYYTDFKSGGPGGNENWAIERFNDWPVLDRKLVMEAGNTLLAENINLKKCKVSRTGGTTGPPLRLYRDTEIRSWSLAAFYRFYEWMGIEPGMPEAELWGSTKIRNQKSTQNSTLKTQLFSRHPAHVPPPKIFDRISKFRSYNAFSFNDLYLEAVVADMKKFKPKLIRGYLSAILLLANHIKRNNIKGIEPIAVSSTSEMLFPEYRRVIEEAFQAPLFDQYGCGECNSIAFECKAHNGRHITMEHCILEQDPENNFIVTNLDNYSQPFIRYKNGDKGIITYEPCSCGNASPRITELHGRANENIILKDDASVNGVFFANLLDDPGFINSNKMIRFQVVQEKAGEIAFRVEVKDQMSDKDLKKLYDVLMPFFNKVVISQYSSLSPESGGKFRYIVSKIADHAANPPTHF